MKFSKLLTTAMMSVALVASSSAFAAEETTWWSMNFDGLTIEEGSSLTNTLNAVYSEKGAWSTEEGDLSELVDNKLKLNTQGTNLTWTPNGENDTTAITYIDADVTFVGSDSAPTISEEDIHTAVYLKNIVDDTTGDVTNSVLCAWVKTADGNKWEELTGVVIKEKDENDNLITYNLRIMLYADELSFYINDQLLQNASGETKLISAKREDAGKVTSVSFRGTGEVDNFAASYAAKEIAGEANLVGYTVFCDNEDVTSVWQYTYYLVSEFVPGPITLDGGAYEVVSIYPDAQDNSFTSLGNLAAVKLVSGEETYTVVVANGEFTGDVDVISKTDGTDLFSNPCYAIVIDTDSLTVDAEYTLEFYYGEYTPSDDPDPDPDPEVPAVKPDKITIAAITGPVDGEVVVTVVPAEEGGLIKAGVNYWAVVSATLGGDETALEPVTVDADTDSLEITVPATGDSLFIKVMADTAAAE